MTAVSSSLTTRLHRSKSRPPRASPTDDARAMRPRVGDQLASLPVASKKQYDRHWAAATCSSASPHRATPARSRSWPSACPGHPHHLRRLRLRSDHSSEPSWKSPKRMRRAVSPAQPAPPHPAHISRQWTRTASLVYFRRSTTFSTWPLRPPRLGKRSRTRTRRGTPSSERSCCSGTH